MVIMCYQSDKNGLLMKWHLYPCSIKKIFSYLDSPVLGCGRGWGCRYCVLLVSIAVCHVQWSWVCKHYQCDNNM